MSVPSSLPDPPHSRPDVLPSLGSTPVVMPATASVKAVLAQLGNPAAEGDDAVLLVENERLVGLVSDLDAVRFLAHGVNLEDPVSQHMTQTLTQITWDQIKDPLDALNLMRQQQIHHLPVVDDQGRPLRIISITSLQAALTPPNILKLQAVKSRTTRELTTARVTDSTLSVAKQLAAQPMSCVAVVEDAADGQTTLVGVVLRQDVLRFQARQLDLAQLPVQAVMREAQFCLQPSDSLWLAYQEMSQRRLPCLVVVTPQRQPLGVITPLDLLYSLDHREFQSSVSTLWRNFRQSEWDQAELWKTHNAELERLVQTRTRQLEEQLKIDRLLTSLTQRIHEFLDVQDILSTTVDEVRQLLQVDRAVVYRLADRTQGEVVAESVVPPWPSLLGQTIVDECFTQNWSESYRHGRIQAVEDVQRAGLSPCHTDLLAGLTIRANLVVPIVCDDQLWGLLVINQCGQPRRWHDWEVRLIEQLARSVAIAIRQSEYYDRLQADIEMRKDYERHLQQLNDALEQKVVERTAALQQEVDHRREAEVALAQTNQQLQAMLNAVPAMVSWVSADGHYLGCNHRLAAMVNLTPEDFVGQPVGFIANSSPFSEFVERFLAGDAESASEETEFSVNGTIDHWLLVAQKYDQGTAAVVVGLDITDRKRGEAEREQAKAALQMSETKFRSLVEQTNDWVWELDDQFCFTYINPRATEILGYPPSEILGHRFSDFMAEDEAIRFSTILGHLIQQRQPFTQIEARALHMEGQGVVLEISGSPIFDAAGDFQGYRGITRDITERKQIEVNIRKALTREKELSDLKTRFISMASHEFRTPLTTILASAESLDRYRHKFSPEKQQTILNRIQSSVHHVIGLLNDVLTMGKTEAGKLTYNPAAMDLQQFCQDVIEELQFAHTDPISPIELLCQGNHFRAMADEKLLRHTLINLLSNAIKYSPDYQPITVRLTCTATEAVFEVKDHGIGIPAEDQGQMFEPFHRGNNVGNISGTGLGMVIAKRAAEAHQGRISFTSTAGVGTTFTAIFPLDFLE